LHHPVRARHNAAMDTTTQLQRTDYAAICEGLLSLNTQLAKLHSRDDVQAAARHLGRLHKKRPRFENDTELALLFDYLNYSYRPRGFNAAELYLRTHAGRLDAFTRTLLSHMAAALYTIVNVEAAVEEGVFCIRDLLQDSAVLLLDTDLSPDTSPGGTFAGHLLVCDGFSVFAGAILPVDQALLNADPATVELLSRPPGDPSWAQPALRTRLARTLMAASLRQGHTQG
jgi:hypothetical protein